VDVKGRHKGVIGLFRLYADLRKLKIDAVADLHNVLRSKVVRALFTLSGKRVAFTDKGRAEKKALTRSVDKEFKPLRTMFDRHGDTFKRLGYGADLALGIVQKPIEMEDATLAVSGSKEGYAWIGIAPFAQYESKVYPLDLMGVVIDQLAALSSTKYFIWRRGAGGGAA